MPRADVQTLRTSQPTGTRDRATNMSWHGLCDDLKQTILGMSLQDRRGNTTVPGLVLATGLRRVSKSVATQFAAVKTPYDAEVTYEGSWPVSFKGGYRFGEPCPGAEQSLFIVRDPPSGHMFACTTAHPWPHGFRTVDDFAEVRDAPKQVERLWPLWRLAQLLNGHCADFSKRLPDVVALAGGAEVLVSKHELHDPPSKHRKFERSLVRYHNQIETLSHNGLDAPPQAHKDDFISHAVYKVGGTLPYLVKCSSLMLATGVDYGYTLWDLEPYTIDDPPVFDFVQGVPMLGVALGWYDRGDIVQATGWMTSVYCHGRKGVPTYYRRALPEDQLRRMGVLAQRRVDKRAAAAPPVARGSQKRGRGGNDGPAARVGRQPRGAALAAKRKMGDQLMCDAYQNSDGRLQSWLKPKEARDLEKTQIGRASCRERV